jgi:hypothetical protein
VSLAPLVHPDIRGVEGKPHPVQPVCACPGCISVSQQRHHLWPRSYLRGQPVDWVKLPSGRVVSNGIGLCMRHHGFVTGGIGGHKAQIHLEPGETFIWLTPDGNGGWVNEGLLFPQPFSEDPIDLKPRKALKTQADLHTHLSEGQTCTACGYTRPMKREAQAKRPTKNYGILVPDDAEIGGDVLDEWVEQLALILGFGSDVSQRLVRYHAIVAALAWTMQNRQAFIEDIMEVKAS